MESPVSREQVAAEIRAELARQRKTLKALSEATDITLNTLRRRLDGTYPFYFEELERVCSFLNVPVSSLVSKARDAA